MRRISPIVVALLLPLSLALAHDTGFGHSRRTLLVTSAENSLALEYRIVLAADEALIEATHIDADGDGEITKDEQDAHFANVARRLIAGLRLQTADGRLLKPTFVRYELQNSLAQTFRFSVETDALAVSVEDRNFAHKPGQVRILAGQGVKVATIGDGDPSHVDRLNFNILREKTAP